MEVQSLTPQYPTREHLKVDNLAIFRCGWVAVDEVSKGRFFGG